MDCFITRTGSFLPGSPVDNQTMLDYLGNVDGEEAVQRQVLAANGITQRYYALDRQQNETHDVYQMAALAVQNTLADIQLDQPITYLSAGSTYTPFSGPGMGSLLHDRLSKMSEMPVVDYALEVNSNAGVCTSAAMGLINACRAVRLGDHAAALSVGSELPSRILKSSVIQPVEDKEMMEADLKLSLIHI